MIIHKFPIKQEKGKGSLYTPIGMGEDLKVKLFIISHISSISDICPACSWISRRTGKPKIYSLET